MVILCTCYCPLRYVLLSFQVRVTVLTVTCYCPLRCVLLSSQVRVTALSDTCCFSFNNVLPSFRVCVTFQIRFKSKMRINIDITAALRAVLVKTTRNILRKCKGNCTVGTPPKRPCSMVRVHISRYFLVFEVVSRKLTHRPPNFFTFSDSLDQKEHTVKV